MPTAPDPVIGATITDVRPMTAAELEAEGWDVDRHGAPAALVLSTGTVLYPSRDEEGNGYGALFGATPDGKNILVTGSEQVR